MFHVCNIIISLNIKRVISITCTREYFFIIIIIHSLIVYVYIDKQRMLERAKARREKLDEQLVNAGHDIKKRSPLKGNVQLEQMTGKIYFYNFVIF